MSKKIGGTYLFNTISEISEHLQNKTISVQKLIKMCLQRIEDTKVLNAFISVNHMTLHEAEHSQHEIDKGQKLNRLDGIPIAIKDNFCTEHLRTTCASKMLSNFIPPYNASVVQRLINCGAIVIGKTNMDEFGLGSGNVDSYFGPVKNPWRSGLKFRPWKRHKCCYSEKIKAKLPEDDFFISGGSSGGSAVAVATGCCFGAIGSDSGGSTRSPAAKCGIVGFKPTYGLISRHGLIPLCNSADVPGILTRTVDDAAILLNSIAGWDSQDSTTCKKHFQSIFLPEKAHVKGLKIGIPSEYLSPDLSLEIKELWLMVAEMLIKNGAEVTSVSLPHTKYSIVCYSILNCCDVASNFARFDGIKYGHRPQVKTSAEELFATARHEGFGDVVRSRILAGNYFLLKKNYEKYFVKATQVRQLIYQDFQNVFESGIDLLLTPVTLSDAVPYSKWTKKTNREHLATEDFCTQPVNLAGLPAISIPCTLSKEGLPLSLQLIGQSFQEETLLTAAKWLEQNLDFPVLDYDVQESSFQ